jgi:hypothetical protein
VIFGDYAPPHSPTPGQQRDALRKGLGRAMLWALSGRLETGLLLSACLENQVFDPQCEGSRVDWLWGLIETTGAIARFKEPLLNALVNLTDDRNAIQLCELAKMYAKAGYDGFRDRLYKIVESKPFSAMPWLGEDELLQVEAAKGFIFAARLRGKSLVIREWDWDDRSLFEKAEARFGKKQVQDLLEANSGDDIIRFCAAWHGEEQKKKEDTPRVSYEKRMQGTSVSEIISAAESKTPAAGLFMGWGKHADPGDLRLVLQRLWLADNPVVIANYLTVFFHRALPDFDPRLIEFCGHSDENVRRRAFRVLSKNTSPLIRAYALRELDNGLHVRSSISLFISNYKPGDEERVLDALLLSADQDELHWLLMDIKKILENNPDADPSRLGVIVYACTPCQNCRFDALKLLRSQNAVPPWMMDEIRFDANDECRKQAD